MALLQKAQELLAERNHHLPQLNNSRKASYVISRSWLSLLHTLG